MGYQVQVNNHGEVVSRQRQLVQFDYEAFNAQQCALADKEERYRVRQHEQLVKQQKRRAQLMEEYEQLKQKYIKTGCDRRLKKSTREARLDAIVEAMLNVEELLCV